VQGAGKAENDRAVLAEARVIHAEPTTITALVKYRGKQAAGSKFSVRRTALFEARGQKFRTYTDTAAADCAGVASHPTERLHHRGNARSWATSTTTRKVDYVSPTIEKGSSSPGDHGNFHATTALTLKGYEGCSNARNGGKLIWPPSLRGSHREARNGKFDYSEVAFDSIDSEKSQSSALFHGRFRQKAKNHLPVRVPRLAAVSALKTEGKFNREKHEVSTRIFYDYSRTRYLRAK